MGSPACPLAVVVFLYRCLEAVSILVCVVLVLSAAVSVHVARHRIIACLVAPLPKL